MNCTKCQGTGYIKVSQFEVSACECLLKKILTARFKESNIPMRLAKFDVEDWNLKQDANGDDLSPNQIKRKEKIYNYLQTMVSSPKFPFTRTKLNGGEYNSVIFYGNKDSGKSLCLAILAKNAIKHGAEVRYYDWLELCMRLDRYDNREELDQISEDFAEIDLIVIDGIDKVEMSNAARNQIARFFKNRFNYDKWIIASTTESAINEKLFMGWSDFVENSLLLELT